MSVTIHESSLTQSPPTTNSQTLNFSSFIILWIKLLFISRNIKNNITLKSFFYIIKAIFVLYQNKPQQIGTAHTGTDTKDSNQASFVTSETDPSHRERKKPKNVKDLHRGPNQNNNNNIPHTSIRSEAVGLVCVLPFCQKFWN